MYFRNTAIILIHFTNLQTNMFLVGIRKNIFTALFLDFQERHYWSTWKANVCIFLYIYRRKFLLQILRKFLSDVELYSFLNAARFSGLVKCLTFFHINWKYWKFKLFFNILIFPSIALKHWNFSDNLDFRGQIVAEFLIRTHLLSKFVTLYLWFSVK